MIFLIGHVATGKKTVHTQTAVVISMKFTSVCPTSACIAFVNKIYFPMIPRQKGGRKTQNVSLESCNQIWRLTRIQDPVEFRGGKENLKRPMDNTRT